MAISETGAHRADVVVIGAGIFGLAVAEAAARAGLAVRVLEAATVGAGASGGVVGALSPHVPDDWNPKKAFQFAALAGAEAYWRRIEAAAGLASGYGRTGRLIPLATAAARELAAARATAAAAHWAGAGAWRVEDAEAAAGWIAPGAAPFGVVCETLSARVFPRRALAALAGAARAAGAHIDEGSAALAVEPGRVRTAEGWLAAGGIVVAAGVAGFGLLQPLVGRRAGTGVKGQAALLAGPVDPGLPTIYADGIYVIPHADGTVAVGSTSENAFADPGATDGRLDALLDRAAALCPPLRGMAVVERWAGLRPKAARRDPMLGPVPGAPGVYAALGGFKIGLGLTPEVGRVLAAMLAGEPAVLPDSFTVAHHLTEKDRL